MVCTNDKKKHKLAVRWQGPMEITGTDSDFVYYVKMIGTDKKSIKAHVQRMKRFAGKEFFCVPELIYSAQHDASTFEIETLLGWILEETMIKWKS